MPTFRRHRLEPGPRLPELEAGEGVVGDRKRNCVSRKGREMFGRSKVCNAHHVTPIFSAHSHQDYRHPLSPPVPQLNDLGSVMYLYII